MNDLMTANGMPVGVPPQMGRFLCLRDCEGPVRDKDGNIQMAKTHHEGEERPMRKVWYEGEIYEFETVEQMPLKVTAVVKLDGQGMPVFMDDPRKNDPAADMVPVHEFEVDPETGKRHVKVQTEGYNHFVRLDNLGNPVPMEQDQMLHDFLVREMVRQRRRELALAARGKARQGLREAAAARAEQIEAEANEILEREGIAV